MHRPADRFITPEGEGNIRHSAGNMNPRQGFTDTSCRFNEVHRIIVVFFNPGRDREDIRIKDDVFWRKANLFGQDRVGPGTNLDLAISGVSLSGFIKSHDNDRRSIGQTGTRLFQEWLFAFLQGNRIDNRLALHAAEGSPLVIGVSAAVQLSPWSRE